MFFLISFLVRVLVLVLVYSAYGIGHTVYSIQYTVYRGWWMECASLPRHHITSYCVVSSPILLHGLLWNLICNDVFQVSLYYAAVRLHGSLLHSSSTLLAPLVKMHTSNLVLSCLDITSFYLTQLEPTGTSRPWFTWWDSTVEFNCCIAADFSDLLRLIRM